MQSELVLGRLPLGAPWQWYESVGDPVTALGGAVVPNQRTAPAHQVTISTLNPDAFIDTVATRLSLRRRLRSLLNNSPLKFQGYLYVVYSDDTEQNGWYAFDATQLQDITGASGLATGIWQAQQANAYLVGHQRTHREARLVWMKSLGGGLYPRDALGWVYLTDFSFPPALELSYLPYGATQAALTVSGQVQPPVMLPAGRDGGVCSQVVGISDLNVVAYERPESALNLSDVVVYDRRGQTSAQSFYNATVLADNPMGYWRFDDPTGTSAADSSGSGFTGTYSGGFTLSQTGALNGSGDTDTAVLLDGSSGEITVPFETALNPAATCTYECWVKLSGTPGGTVSVLQSVSGNTGAAIRVTNARVPQFLVGNGSSFTTASGAALTNGQWTHLALVYDGTEVLGYVNGVLAASAVASYSPNTTATLVWGGGAGFFPGDLDEAAVFAYAFSATQIANHYASGVCYDGGNQWEEVYGPDYPWAWLTEGGTNDCPILSNGLVRVRYNTVGGTPGFSVDVWTPAGAAPGTTNGTAGWVEQGKMTVWRESSATTPVPTVDTVWSAASLIEYTPDRAVIMVVLSYSGDPYSRERVFITVQRGEFSVQFEQYPAINSSGTQEAAYFGWYPALNSGAADLNNSICKIDSKGTYAGNVWSPGAAGMAKYASTAGMGAGSGDSGLFGASTVLGYHDFTPSENWVSLLRCPTAFSTVAYWQQTLVVLQQATQSTYSGTSSAGYGVTQDAYFVGTVLAAPATTPFGYLQVQVTFGPTVSNQVIEAENMTVQSGVTPGVVTDSGASGPATNNAVEDSQTSITHATVGIFSNLANATYRVFARCRVGGGGTGSFYALAVGSVVTTKSSTYVWLDLGEWSTGAANAALYLVAYSTSGQAFIDRCELVLVQDRARSNAIYAGSRDSAQSSLYDSRMIGALVAR